VAGGDIGDAVGVAAQVSGLTEPLLQGLVDGSQRVKAIGTRCADIKAKVDLRVRTNGCGHTGSL